MASELCAALMFKTSSSSFYKFFHSFIRKICIVPFKVSTQGCSQPNPSENGQLLGCFRMCQKSVSEQAFKFIYHLAIRHCVRDQIKENAYC